LLGNIDRHQAQQAAPGRVVEEKAEAEHLADLSARGGYLFNGSRRLSSFENRRIAGVELGGEIRPMVRRIVDVQYLPRLILDEGQRRAVAHEGKEARLAGFEVVLGLSLLPAQLALHQRVFDRRPQAYQAILEQVVGGSPAHQVDSRVFGDGPGHHDERNVQPALIEQQLQRPAGIQFRQGVVGQDHIGRRVEVRQKVRLGLHPLHLRIEAAAPQFVRHQFGVRGPVFQYQYAKCGLGAHFKAPRWRQPSR
jgi:hypothetical protein